MNLLDRRSYPIDDIGRKLGVLEDIDRRNLQAQDDVYVAPRTIYLHAHYIMVEEYTKSLNG